MIKVNSSDLIKKISLVKKLIKSASKKSVSSYIKIKTDAEDMVLEVSDTGVYGRFVVDSVEGSLDPCIVQAQSFCNTIGKLPKNSILLLENLDNRLAVTSGTIKFYFDEVSDDDFPIQPCFSDVVPLVLDAKCLKRAICLGNFVLPKSSDPHYVQFCNVLISTNNYGFDVVATDGFRMSLSEIKQEQNSDLYDNVTVLVPRNVASVLMDMEVDNGRDLFPSATTDKEGSFLLSIGKNLTNMISTSSDSKEFLVFRQAESGFPNYKSISNAEYKNFIKLDRTELLKAVKECSAVACGDRDTLVMKINGTAIDLSLSSDIGSASVSVSMKEYFFDDIEDGFVIPFCYKYVLDYLQNSCGDWIDINFSDIKFPVGFHHSEKELENFNYRYFLMPVTL